MPEYTTRTDKCLDCKRSVIEMGDWFMVWDAIWAEAGLAPIKCVCCVTCLEARLGRRLTVEDFMDCPLNWIPERWVEKQSDILLDRKAGFFQASWWPRECNDSTLAMVES